MTTPSTARPALDALVAEGQLAGAVALAWRDGRVRTALTTGWRDVESRAPMRRDALFRIASLTKPVTSVAALMLHREGRFALDDPVAAWAPELRDPRVLRAPDGPLDDTVPAERPITFRDLLTHRAGFTYGAFHAGPLRDAYRAALGADIDSHRTPDAWIAGLGTLPLLDQPGRAFHYGVSTDLLGLLLARMEDAPLGDVLRRRILAPLGMDDTRFDLPDAQRDRAAGMYGFDAHGALERRDAHPPHEPAFLPRRPPGTTFVSGGAGLWSTADDYLRFARLFVGGGAVDGVRLLDAETLRLMTTNALTPAQIAGARTLGRRTFVGQGFGLGVAVVLDPGDANVLLCRGSAGTVGWPGAYGGWWQADPTDGSALVLLAHNALDLERAAQGFGLGVYAAVAAFHASEAAAAG
ncbi:serine hydrolase domain-containing protein [Roseisolibacter sp. H3M3-2]|uniref:serine hydrolase domain-containing protein n=1 Tax=Roseisolibacter sp. H3M3-2 TaxID=3031323 RepID=UPI0023D98D66|nr:serine hydrolase domain-containing protein [Roseisolibacter sp. H3M3-2]MDF1503450.1 serine hydrolase [Roseisolibacter sp. H3M3-2]